MDSPDVVQPQEPASSEPVYQVTVRTDVRKISDGKLVGRPNVAVFDMVRPVKVERLGEAAAEAARLVADGMGGTAAILARVRVSVRDLARKPGVARGSAILAAGLRKLAVDLEALVSAAASKIVVAAPPDSE